MSFNFQTTRLLSLDFFRGVAILGVVTVHLVIIGIFFTVDNALNVLPTGVLAVFTPLIIFAPMAGLFAFISALANGLTVQKRLAKGYSIRSSIQPIFVTAMALLVIHFIYIAFFKEQMPTITKNTLSTRHACSGSCRTPSRRKWTSWAYSLQIRRSASS